MTEYTHEQIAALLAGRTPGEWIADGFGCKDTVFTDSQEYGICYDMMNEADAEFIAAAPGIVAQLLARVEALEAESELLRQSRDGLLALGVHAAPFIEPTNRQLSNLLEGIRAEQREVDDD